MKRITVRIPEKLLTRIDAEAKTSRAAYIRYVLEATVPSHSFGYDLEVASKILGCSVVSIQSVVAANKGQKISLILDLQHLSGLGLREAKVAADLVYSD